MEKMRSYHNRCEITSDPKETTISRRGLFLRINRDVICTRDLAIFIKKIFEATEEIKTKKGGY